MKFTDRSKKIQTLAIRPPREPVVVAIERTSWVVWPALKLRGSVKMAQNIRGVRKGTNK